MREANNDSRASFVCEDRWVKAHRVLVESMDNGTQSDLKCNAHADTLAGLARERHNDNAYVARKYDTVANERITHSAVCKTMSKVLRLWDKDPKD